ncbi:MAG: KH domain-containing protein [Clostridia bacterium]|jgi:predicted RNA-binding protein YlqC (UPF0109 family)|uniref:KH domain-containing protein n=1 Tax=Pumilibacter muris TaxID=2941510 RepID=UPI00203E11F9|nr:KH domain-containing protein [Pumilibacter muris]MCI8595891.1 KH domain-containing protein [Clostridia bacterium]
MVELVQYLVTKLVDNKEAVKVTESEDGIISVSVDKADMGKIIGRQGKIAKSIRTIVKAACAGGEKTYTVDILEAE